MKKIKTKGMAVMVCMTMMCGTLAADGNASAAIGVSVNDVSQQNRQLTGKIVDAQSGETLPGVNIVVEGTSTGANNYVFADIQGKGHFVGINYYVHCPTPMWYGEGDDMWFIDGEQTPSLIGTGTEDFFNTSWCPKEKFSHPYFGYPRVNDDIGWLGRTHVYRFL